MKLLLAHGNRLLAFDPGRQMEFDRIGVASIVDSETEIERFTVLPGVSLIRLSVAPDDSKVVDLRAELQNSDAERFQMLARAQQLLSWRVNHQFCGRCGTEKRFGSTEMVLICPSCTHHAYPRISPCIITLVEDGDRILLAHNARFDENRFSTLAGFVEAGESVEQAVAREIKEEVGVDIGEFRYFKSQAWPFPDSLMLAFFAQYQGGELQPDGVEITEARWFTRDELNSVTLPPKFSISRQLIDDWVNRSS